MRIELTVNGKNRKVETAPMARLLDLLRDDLLLIGCKEGCGEGECGACSVIMNGMLVNACMIPAMQASGAEILTIEGLGGRDNLDVLQQAFIDEGAVHCGFCTPGMILAARCLLENTPNPSLLEIKTALSGNLCRCTGYERIYAAVNKAVATDYRPPRTGSGIGAVPVFSQEEEGRYFAPSTLAEALDVLADHPDLLLLSGNTDIGPEMKGGKVQPSEVMDIFSIPELTQIVLADGHICIGACVTNTQIMKSEVVRRHLPALYQASCGCAAPAIRNRATIGGNCCTASGAADLPGALFALGAKARVVSRQGERLMDAPAFIKAYRKPNLEKGELLAELIVPVPPSNARQQFFKRGSRAALTLSRVSLTMYAEIENDVLTTCRAAAGSMSPTPIRLPKLEAFLTGKPLTEETIWGAVETVRNELTPRKSAQYRKSLSGNLVRRFLESLAQ